MQDEINAPKKKRTQFPKEFVTNREAVRLTGLTGPTLRVWAKSGKVVTYTTPSGQFLYNTKCLQTLIGSFSNVEEKKKIIYCRVSSRKQLPDLDRQVENLRERFPLHELVTDCASGINFNRKGLQSILDYAIQGNLAEVVVAHKDRLSRFAFDLIKWIIEFKGGKVIVLDDSAGKSTEQELAEDLLSIVHIYTCRQMGRRRYTVKNVKDKIKDLIQTETDYTGLDEHEQGCIQQDSGTDQ
jgi:putative resolvase